MILLDCGNSRLKWQYWDHQKLRASGALSYENNWPGKLGRHLDQHKLDTVYLTSVLDDSRQQQLESLLSARQADCYRLQSAATDLGVTSAYAEPESLGDDRWMALLAAHQLAPRGCMVIDAGSAITLDLLRADGQHLGGAIIPGTRTSRDHFRKIFSYIDLADLQADSSRPPGCSTPEAIHIDYDHDPLDILIDLLQQWKLLLGDKPAILLAGGDADRVEARVPMSVQYVPDLVFCGMRRLIESRGL